MKRACVNFTTSRVTSRLMGIRLLYRMMNVSRLYAKFREMSPEVTDKIPLCNNPDLPKHAINIMRLKQSCYGLTGPGQVPAGLVRVFSVPDGCAHRADQCHDQQDAKQNQDLHVGHPLHIRALQWRLGGVLGVGKALVRSYNVISRED